MNVLGHETVSCDLSPMPTRLIQSFGTRYPTDDQRSNPAEQAGWDCLPCSRVGRSAHR